MKTAYLYVRVSTDEQKKKGFSLIEQEDRLLKHCELNKIKVKGIFREDFSAKNFNRPEWKKLIKTIKKNRYRPAENILFIKWDRFSRNIECAYQMMGILRHLNTQAMAIDQPIDFEVPESIVMLAVYLSIPEAENSRRGMNTSDGMRRARKMGRWPAKAPIGYMNQIASDGKKIIVTKQPEADYIRWSFEEYSKGNFTINHIRRMANFKGLRCSRNNFWKMLHNPFYCGLVTVPATRTEDAEFVNGIHVPLISEELFGKVQSLIDSRRTKNAYKQRIRPIFLLRGFLMCPFCDRRFTGSVSTGRNAKYRYYHCSVSKCKGRIRADILDGQYEEQLKKIVFRPQSYELFQLILKDEDISIARQEFLNERNKIHNKISEQKLLILKIKRHFLEDKIDYHDFKELRAECKEVLSFLNEKLNLTNERLFNCSATKCDEKLMVGENSVLKFYKNQDVVGKKFIIELFTPSSFNPITKELYPLQINQSLSMITNYTDQSKQLLADLKFKLKEQIPDKKHQFFSERKVSIAQAMKVLKKNGIETTEEQTKVILDFLYLLAKHTMTKVHNIPDITNNKEGDFEHLNTTLIA